MHATSSLPARWTPLVERKPDSEESGIIDDDQEEGENLLRKSLTMDAAAREVENEISTAMGNSNAKAGVNLHVSAS